MKTIFLILAVTFMVLTLVACGAGIVLMASGSEMNRKYGNRLMAVRVYLQAISIGLIVIAFS
ncbi:MAG TPA: twin transmembrane helix small protein [Alphaproteobacteria bacterium]|nr:twin transmembrane helix small protein [Alphaproteobacteria bacterium]